MVRVNGEGVSVIRRFIGHQFTDQARLPSPLAEGPGVRFLIAPGRAAHRRI
jgi:hypothetical protein